jgi:[ribosomal protein S5]-alanine N-acetyltransferase
LSRVEFFFHADDDFFLRPLREEDVDGPWWGWFNDESVTRLQEKGYYPNTPEAQRAYFHEVVSSRENVVLAIIDREGDRHVGNVGLHQIDHLHRTAVLGIVIGEAAARGRRIGSRSWAAITDYGFLKLNLHKICATVIDGNEASLRSALAAGYRDEGRQREQIYKDGGHLDLIHLGLLRTEWLAMRPEAL